VTGDIEAMTSKPRIAHLITESLPFGGAQRNTLLTVAGLVRDGYPTALACGPGGPLIPLAREAGALVHVVPPLVREIAPGRDTRALLALYRVLRGGRYDIVHTHSSKAGLLGRLAAWLARVPVIVHTIHGLAFELRGAGGRGYLAYERALGRVTRRVICVGEVFRQEVERWGVVPPGKLVTVHSGIDLAAYVPTVGGAELKRVLGLGDAWPLIGTIGRLVPNKAPLDLVAALPHLLRVHPGAHAVFAGDGPLRADIEETARALGVQHAVTLLGQRDDIADLLDALDVYVMCSRSEGVGRALSEALAFGVPVVATPVNGVTELVEDGETGLIVPVGAPVRIAGAIARLVQDRALAARLGAGGRERARRLMDSRRMVAALEALYEEEYDRVRDRRYAVPHAA
jgi:glycosyltransferase involved in cell wall biosynthesis